MQVSLYYAGTPGDGFGWGVANRELIKALSGLCTVWHGPLTPCPEKGISETVFSGPVFQPLQDHDFNPVSPVRGRRNFAYTFFEFPLGPNAAANAAKYDVVFCGSSWCLERMQERGITNGRVLVQGVDFDVFKPQQVARNDGEFRLFSGGKFEYRKGQDIVIAAFKELSQRHDNMRLVTAWYNPWPGLRESVKDSPYIKWWSVAVQQHEWALEMCALNGIDPSKVTALGQLSQSDLAAVMNQTDLGVFPNRCEGGTNLVLMEYMACGKPVVATYGTGHTDVWDFNQCFPVFGAANEMHWEEPTPECVVNAVETVMNRQYAGGEEIKQFTWERAARTILDTVLEYS